MRRQSILFAGILLLLGCGGSKSIQSEIPKESIIISQGNGGFIDNSGEFTVTLERDEFTIEFFNKRYQGDEHHTAKIAFFSSALSLDQAISGIRAKDISYFDYGTSIAGTPQGYDEIWLDHSGNHSVYYSDEDDKRATLLGEKNGMLHLSFPVHTIMINEMEFKMKKIDIPNLYIVIYIDRNLDGWVQDGELTKATVIFK